MTKARETEDLLRRLAPQVLGALVRRIGHFDTAEDAVQEALFCAAIRSCPPGSQIALTLRAVGGLSTAEIARAFPVPEATMARRITRAKQRIAGVLDAARPTANGAPGGGAARPLSDLQRGLCEHLGAQTFTHRVERSGEAIRLTRLLRASLPDDAEVAGLLALMLLTDARRPARSGPNGELTTRSRWPWPVGHGWAWSWSPRWRRTVGWQATAGCPRPCTPARAGRGPDRRPAAYRTAAELATSLPQQRNLSGRAARLVDDLPPDAG